MIINGKLYKNEQTIDFKVPPIYEVIRVMNGIPLFFSEHMERLFTSLELSGYAHDLSFQLFEDAIFKLVEETQIANNNIRVEIGLNAENQLIWTLFWVKSIYPEKRVWLDGVYAVSLVANRENPHAKIFRSQFTDQINQLRMETGAFEIILVKDDGTITEGSRSNLFFIKNQTIYSAKEADVLKGVTRKHLIALI